jgi:LCP family protein required for cell wall assembly
VADDGRDEESDGGAVGGASGGAAGGAGEAPRLGKEEPHGEPAGESAEEAPQTAGPAEPGGADGGGEGGEGGEPDDADGAPCAPGAEAAAEPDAAPRETPAQRRARIRRRTRRVLVVALCMLCAVVLTVVGAGYWALQHYTGRVERIPNAFPTSVPPSALPSPSKSGSQTFLLVGVDARSDLPTTGRGAKAPEWKPGAQRSDTMMLVHLPADHKHAYVVSLPRDSWVPIPGHGTAKLNAAFSWGGPPLLIDTVQRLTRVKIDHLAVIDWSGFKKLTDAVGGVDVTVDKTVSRRNGPGGVWTAGRHHMDGDDALDYVRERYGLPGGDLDRTHRQQNFLRAVLSKMLSGGTLINPLKLKRTLDQVTSVVSVDDRLSNGALRDLVWDMRSLRASGMVFMNAPVAGFDSIRKQSVVLLDDTTGSGLWESMRNDTMADFVADHELDKLGTRVP